MVSNRNLCMMLDAERAKTKILLQSKCESGQIFLLKYDEIDDNVNYDSVNVYYSDDRSMVAFVHREYAKICFTQNNLEVFSEVTASIHDINLSHTNYTIITKNDKFNIEIWHLMPCRKIKKLSLPAM
jgi:hypothetical protein